MSLIRCITACSILVLASAAPSFAQEKTDSMPGTLTGSVSLNSDYISRGISQTANGAALQGSADWAFNTGFHGTSVYMGAFASNVDFPGTRANLETDFLAGVRGTVSKVDLDLGYAFYHYFGATSSLDMDYSEIIAKASRDFDVVKVSGQFNYSPDYSGDTGSGYYLNARLDKPLPYKFAGFASAGHQWIDNNNLATLPDYYDWSIGISRPVWKFNVTLSYTDTNLSKNDCYNRAYGNVCSARAVLNVGIPF